MSVTCSLPVVKGDLLSLDDVSDGKHAESREVGIEAVDPHVEDGQVGVAAVVDEVRHVAVERRVHRVLVVVHAQIVVQVKQVRPTFGICE